MCGINQVNTDLEADLYTYLQTQLLHTRGDFVQDGFIPNAKEPFWKKKTSTNIDTETPKTAQG